MTGFANITAINMTGGFTRRDSTIMATDATAHHFIMINVRIGNGRPRCRSGLMTGITGIGGIDMSGTFSASDNTIMTADAGSNHLCVIYCRIIDGYP